MTKKQHRPDDRAVYIISVAAELAGVHPQTLRIYERKGLLNPARTAGNTRRYSERDIARLRMIQELTQVHGLNLAGVKMIVEKQEQLDRMRRRLVAMDHDMQRARRRVSEELEWRRRHAARTDIVPLSTVRRLQLRVARAGRPAEESSSGPTPQAPGQVPGRTR